MMKENRGRAWMVGMRSGDSVVNGDLILFKLNLYFIINSHLLDLEILQVDRSLKKGNIANRERQGGLQLV